MKYSKEVNEILFQMRNNGGLDKSMFEYRVLKDLFADKLISPSSNYTDNLVYLTDRGRAYLDGIKDHALERKSNKIHMWINTVMSILSLIVAIVALFK